jgi:hypothetical protein
VLDRCGIGALRVGADREDEEQRRERESGHGRMLLP